MGSVCCCADGESARAVGAWLASRDVREDIVLYAKGCHPPYCSPSLVAAEVDKALTDLGVDRLDVFSLHRDDPDVPVEAFAEALVEQVESGKLAGFGQRMLDGVVRVLLASFFDRLAAHLRGTPMRGGFVAWLKNAFSMLERFHKLCGRY